MKFLEKIDQIFIKAKLNKLPKKLAVAVSGGCDSLALTIVLNEFCKHKNIELFAITVDHKMRQSSSIEAKALGKILVKEKISHQILEINWSKKPQSNVEAKMREARYEMLCDFCKKNQIKYLFLGHQIDDVAENFLIRLFRGSGLDGLSTMSGVIKNAEITLLRPFLEIKKEELKSYLKQRQIKWLEDESNNDEKFLRNKVRNFLNSLPENELIKKRIKNASDEIAQMRDLFDKKMLLEAKKCLLLQDNGFLLNLEKFQKIEEKIALKILALNITKISGKTYKPRLEKLKIFYNWILTDKFHKARDFYGCVAKKYGKASIIIAKSKILNQ